MCGSTDDAAGSEAARSGLTRRRFLGGAGAAFGAGVLGGCAGLHGRRLDELDPRVPALLAATISV
ncbi:MAG TPA: twin-arginine translocation signal domain-containing protein, partial [Methylomirabilota bacterium]|nr:twin-arginine translocation signal domain-containing protein [Methylomirabilota bacterium]